jgi:hypothetical protein
MHGAGLPCKDPCQLVEETHVHKTMTSCRQQQMFPGGRWAACAKGMIRYGAMCYLDDDAAHAATSVHGFVATFGVSDVASRVPSPSQLLAVPVKSMPMLMSHESS